jgi:hypothetical protein
MGEPISSATIGDTILPLSQELTIVCALVIFKTGGDNFGGRRETFTGGRGTFPSITSFTAAIVEKKAWRVLQISL